jgi:hypothetical protein
MYPHKVNRIFSQNAPPNPTCRNTPNGGNRMAMMIRIKSMGLLLIEGGS